MTTDTHIPTDERVETIALTSDELVYLLSLAVDESLQDGRRRTAALLMLTEHLDDADRIRAGVVSLFARGYVERVDDAVRPVRSLALLAYSLVSASRCVSVGFLAQEPQVASAAVVVVAEHLTLVLTPQTFGVFDVACLVGAHDAAAMVASLVERSLTAEPGTRSALVQDSRDEREDAGVVLVRERDGTWSAGPLAELAAGTTRPAETSADQALGLVRDYLAA